MSVLLLCVASSSWGQKPAASTYPWDKRPAACFGESKVQMPECVLENWPTFDETIRRLAFLYQTEQFGLLDKALTELVSSNKRFVSGRSTASAAYWMFRLLLSGDKVSVRDRDRIVRWRSAMPQSHYAIFAEARLMYANAWNTRGSGFGASVSKESWQLFSMRLRDSEQILLQAPQASKDTPLWHNLLLAISLDTDTVQSDPRDVFERAVQRWPDYYDFYDVMLSRLVPRWGGSWEAVEAFIDHWAKQQVKREGTSLYARLYINLGILGITPDETRMNWSRMRTSFTDLVARYPDPAYKNLFASYACFAKDKAAFGDAMRNVPANLLMPNYWLNGHSHEACMRWAAI